LLPDGVTQCNALAALYTKGSDSQNFNYVSQTDPVLDSLSPFFTEPLTIPLPVGAEDIDCMLNVFNHVSEEAEVSDSAALGACLFSLSKLVASPSGALKVPLIKDGAIRGTVVLKTDFGIATPGQSRAGSAARTKGASRPGTGAAEIGKEYDMTLSCSGLPTRPHATGAEPTCDPMIALYGQDMATHEFAYIGQTEKLVGTTSPSFATSIRMNDTVGGKQGERPMMLMLYDVIDEANIAEGDQLGTAALTWSYLKEALRRGKNSAQLALLDNAGQQHSTAVVTIHLKKVE